MVYGLRYYFRHVGKTDLAIKLPSLKKEATLPVILNRTELKALFKAPKLLKHRIILTLIYSAGLRRQEAINLKIPDIDFERHTIHIRKSKYLKDRIVPLSAYMSRGLKKYLEVEKPHDYLFNGKEADGRYSINGLSWLMREALKSAGTRSCRYHPAVWQKFYHQSSAKRVSTPRSESLVHVQDGSIGRT